MIRIKECGNKLNGIMLLLTAFVFSKCTVSKNSASYILDPHTKICYINDGLQLSIHFYGLSKATNNLKGKEYKQIKRNLIKDKRLEFLCYAATTKAAYYGNEQYLYLIKKGKEYINILDKDTIMGTTPGGKVFIVDTSKWISYHRFKDSLDRCYLFVTYWKKALPSAFSSTPLNELKSSTSVIDNIITGKSYLTGIYSDPYIVAMDEFNYPAPGNYLGAINALKIQVSESGNNSQAKDRATDALGQYYALAGKSDSGMHYYNQKWYKYKYFRNKEDVENKLLPFLVNGPLDSFILSQTNNHDIIAFNENHSTELYRYYMASLLPKLKEAGFTNLALEALVNDNKDSLSMYKYSNGFYTRSPAYNYLIKTALNLNMTIIAYESTGPNNTFQERDKVQAENLIRKLDSIKSGKTIIYCGFAHLAKLGSYAKGTLVTNLIERFSKKIYTVDLEYLNTRFPNINNSAANRSFAAVPNDALLNSRNADLLVTFPVNALNQIKKENGFAYATLNIPIKVRELRGDKIIGLWDTAHSAFTESAPFYLNFIDKESVLKDYFPKGKFILLILDRNQVILWKENITIE